MALVCGGIISSALLCVAAGAGAGETLPDVFEQVHRSVVVIRTTEVDVSEDGDRLTKVAGVGSEVLISRDGKVLTADHVVHAASEIFAEFPNGARVRARVRAVARSADLALLQLDQVPADAVVAPLADSERARMATVGGRTLVVGGDVLLRIQGVPVAAGGQAREALAALKPGDLLRVTILRAGEVRELSTRWAPLE